LHRAGVLCLRPPRCGRQEMTPEMGFRAPEVPRLGQAACRALASWYLGRQQTKPWSSGDRSALLCVLSLRGKRGGVAVVCKGGGVRSCTRGLTRLLSGRGGASRCTLRPGKRLRSLRWAFGRPRAVELGGPKTAVFCASWGLRATIYNSPVSQRDAPAVVCPSRGIRGAQFGFSTSRLSVNTGLLGCFF
jgi:hypothetical protein